MLSIILAKLSNQFLEELALVVESSQDKLQGQKDSLEAQRVDDKCRTMVRLNNLLLVRMN
jgi:hypothetical protein